MSFNKVMFSSETDKWISWELFEDFYDLPARGFPKRCDFKRCMIYIGEIELLTGKEKER